MKNKTIQRIIMSIFIWLAIFDWIVNDKTLLESIKDHYEDLK